MPGLFLPINRGLKPVLPNCVPRPMVQLWSGSKLSASETSPVTARRDIDCDRYPSISSQHNSRGWGATKSKCSRTFAGHSASSPLDTATPYTALL